MSDIDAGDGGEAAVGGGGGVVDLRDVAEDVVDGENQEEEGYIAFRGRQARGVLYRINPMPPELIQRMQRYVHDGPMERDMRYARAVYGLVNTSGRKDFEMFWESPWNEEHVQDAPRKRKLEAQQRSMAVRSYIRSSSHQVRAGYSRPLSKKKSM